MTRTPINQGVLDSMREPVDIALREYALRSNSALEFDVGVAAKIEPTPEKTTAARSTSYVRHGGEIIGSLVVIVFDQYEGTGNDSLVNIYGVEAEGGIAGKLEGAHVPDMTAFLPRSKEGVHSEAHFTIATKTLGFDTDRDPELFEGNLALLGLRQTNLDEPSIGLVELAQLGRTEAQFMHTDCTDQDPEPTVTLTTGYRTPGWIMTVRGERFGDPHAVANYRAALQVCGFLALSDQVVKADPGLVRVLRDDMRARVPFIQ